MVCFCDSSIVAWRTVSLLATEIQIFLLKFLIPRNYFWFGWKRRVQLLQVLYLHMRAHVFVPACRDQSLSSWCPLQLLLYGARLLIQQALLMGLSLYSLTPRLELEVHGTIHSISMCEGYLTKVFMLTQEASWIIPTVWKIFLESMYSSCRGKGN